jgi:hypothetical protein
MNSKLTAAAGEYYVGYKISCLGYIAAFVRAGVPAADLLASTLDGGRTVAIQVKTTFWAERTRGRGDQKKPAELQFPLGHRAVEDASPNLIFCFVDLRGYTPAASPDVYVIPAKVILADYKGVNVRQWSYFRLHRPIDDMAAYKNQ